MPEHCFADRLSAAILKKRAPCCVGLDPRIDWLPAEFRQRLSTRPTRESIAAALREFHTRILDRIAPIVPAIKPQLAFFEQLGAPGVAAFEHLTDHAHSLGLLVIADAKRGDIGPTAEAYAKAFLGGVRLGSVDISPPSSDCVTINPYFGTDGVQPFLDVCKERGAGLYILVRTSNPSSAEFQNRLGDRVPLADTVAEAVKRWGAPNVGNCGYSSIGAVVGATHRAELAHFRQLMPTTPFLLPGYGAQGAGAGDVVDAFDKQGLGGLVVAARSVNFAYRKGSSEESDWCTSIEQAARAMVDDVVSTLRKNDKWSGA